MSLSWLLTNVFAYLLLPPANLLLLMLVGLVLLRRRPRLGKTILVLAGMTLWLLSLHVVSIGLLRPLENGYPVWDGRTGADVIVVLGTNRYRNAPEFSGNDDVSSTALERLRYAAILARQLKKPLLLTGGKPEGGGRSEAETMQTALQRDFGLTARWLEGDSDNTRENAQKSALILKQAGVSKVFLVTHAWHMSRAVPVFSGTGLQVVPAPMGFASTRPLTLLDFIPRAESLAVSSRALHEWIGLAWYALRA